MHQTKKYSICSGLKITMAFNFSSSEVSASFDTPLPPLVQFSQKGNNIQTHGIFYCRISCRIFASGFGNIEKEMENEIAFALSSSDLHIS